VQKLFNDNEISVVLTGSGPSLFTDLKNRPQIEYILNKEYLCKETTIKYKLIEVKVINCEV